MSTHAADERRPCRLQRGSACGGRGMVIGIGLRTVHNHESIGISNT